MNFDSRLGKKLILSGFLLALIVLHYASYIGHYGFDDMHYAELAANLLQGQIDLSDHFSYRIVPIALTALSFSLFGINDFAATLPPLLASAGVLFLLFKIQERKSAFALLSSLIFCLLTPWYLAYSSKLMPDIFLCFFVFLAIYFYQKQRFSQNTKSIPRRAFFFALSLFLAFNSKGTIILMTPVFAYLLLIDFWLHKQYRFWWYALGFGMALLLLYFLITHALTGDFTTRFKALYSNSYLNRCSYDQQELPILLKRIGRDLILLFHREVMLASSLFVLAGLWQQKIRNVIRMDAETSFWLGLGVLVLLASNFMSISLTAYNPMCLDARHYLFIVPIMAIPGAQALEEMLFERKHRMGFWIMSLLCLAVYFLEYHRYLFTVYLPLIVSTGIAIYLPSQRLKQIFPFILILCLSLPIVNQIQYAQDVQYRKQREVVQAEILTKLKSAYVLGDKVQVNLANYYQGFKTNSELEFFSYDEGPENTSADKPIYILSNRHTQNLLFYEKQDLPFYVQYRSQGDSLCFSDESLGLELWKIDQIIDPSDDLESVFESSMGFESPQPHWNSDPNDWNQEIKRSGKASTLIREFGATLVLELDSLFEPNNSYYLEVSGYAYTADETDASLVVSFENAEGSWKYESTKVNRYLSSYSAWWQIQLNSLIQLNEVPPKSVLKIYLHNPSLHSLYLDDLEVKLGKLP